MRILIGLLALFLVFTGAALFTDSQQEKCRAKGGVLVRSAGMSGFICIKAVEVLP